MVNPGAAIRVVALNLHTHQYTAWTTQDLGVTSRRAPLTLNLALDGGLTFPEARLHATSRYGLCASYTGILILAPFGGAVKTGGVERIRAALALSLQHATAALEVVTAGAAALPGAPCLRNLRGACIAALRRRKHGLTLEWKAVAGAVAAAARVAVGRAVVQAATLTGQQLRSSWGRARAQCLEPALTTSLSSSVSLGSTLVYSAPMMQVVMMPGC